MAAPATPAFSAKDLAASLDWWRDAGVDCDFAEEPTDWLADAVEAEAQPEPPKPQLPAPPPPSTAATRLVKKMDRRIAGDSGSWPTDLDAFKAWWLEEPTLDDGGAAPRITPRGATGAKLMIFVPHPEAEDRDTLLSGAQGKLLGNMLRAMGVPIDQAYIASALPRHTALPDWNAAAATGMGDVLLHHINLAAPERVLLLGRGILSLIPHDTAQGSVSLREFNHEKLKVAAAAGAGLDTMLAQPGEKARFWRRWLQWTAPDMATNG